MRDRTDVAARLEPRPDVHQRKTRSWLGGLRIHGRRDTATRPPPRETSSNKGRHGTRSSCRLSAKLRQLRTPTQAGRTTGAAAAFASDPSRRAPLRRPLSAGPLPKRARANTAPSSSHPTRTSPAGTGSPRKHRRFARAYPCATTEKPGWLLRAGKRDQETRQHATRPVFGGRTGGAPAGRPSSRRRRRLRSLRRSTRSAVALRVGGARNDPNRLLDDDPSGLSPRTPVSALSHHLVLLGGLVALVVVRLFFKVIRLAVLLTAMAAVVLLRMHAHEWEALAHMFGIR